MEMQHTHSNKMGNKMYVRFAIMIVLSFISMYVLMYSMVDILANVIPNVNQIYMAGLMTAAMALVEIVLMGGMYKNKKLNIMIIASGVILLVACFFAIRAQTAVSDKQFLKSMIPHHASAILMVKQAKIQDPEIQKLAEEIISSQQEEINFMKSKLEEMNNK